MGILQRGIALLRMTELAKTAGSVEHLKRMIRALDLGYRDTYLHRDASNAYYRAKGSELQSVIDLTGPLKPSQYLKGDWSRPEAYQFYGYATWYNPVTGLSETGKFTMYSNVDLSDDELTALWSAQRGEYEAQMGVLLTGVEWIDKWHKISAPYRTSLEL